MKEVLDYCNKYLNCLNGELYWKDKPNPRVVIGSSATHLRKDGYKQVKIKGKYYLVHRIVWLIHNGSFPENTVDHLDRDRANNCIDNLRDVTLSKNLTNTSKGYYWCKRERKYLVYVTTEGTRKYVGRCDNEHDARQLRTIFLESI